jgi:hypothetical protein
LGNSRGRATAPQFRVASSASKVEKGVRSPFLTRTPEQRSGIGSVVCTSPVLARNLLIQRRGLVGPPLLAVAGILVMGASSARAETNCRMTFEMKGWSAIYKTAHGDGRITCENGQTASVRIEAKGGGLTFGKSEIRNGVGKYSGVRSIDSVFGSYASASAEAGAVKAAEARALTKGDVSLALSGNGHGFDLGVAFEDFKITRR